MTPDDALRQVLIDVIERIAKRHHNVLNGTASHAYWDDSVDDLLRLCRQQQAQTWREAAKHFDNCCGIIGEVGTPDVHVCNEGAWCEAQSVKCEAQLAAVERERDEWHQMQNGLVRDLQALSRDLQESNDQRQAREQTLAKITAVMPSTWYSDRPLSERLLHLVAQWQQLHIVVKEQEEQLQARDATIAADNQMKTNLAIIIEEQRDLLTKQDATIEATEAAYAGTWQKLLDSQERERKQRDRLAKYEK